MRAMCPVLHNRVTAGCHCFKIQTNRFSDKTQERRECPVDSSQIRSAETPEHAAHPGKRQCAAFVGLDLGRRLQPVLRRRCNRNPKHLFWKNVACHGQERNGFHRLVSVGLNNHCGSRFSIGARKDNGDQLTAFHFQPSISIFESSSRMTFSSALALIIAIASATSCAYPGALTSGTQIVTGLRPAAFILSRCFWTRFAPSAMTRSFNQSVTCNISRKRYRFKLRHFALSTSTPGRGLPSIHSRKAPPAVET